MTKSWSDYWKVFDSLLDNLKEHHQNLMVAELNEAKLHVNGLTDGWYEFKFAVEKTLKANESTMTSYQIKTGGHLIEVLNNSLSNR